MSQALNNTRGRVAPRASAVRGEPGPHTKRTSDGPNGLHDEFDRRRFLELMAASMALAGANGCSIRQPNEEIVPYVRSPEYEVPGKPSLYATAITLGGYATGVLVASHEGRPTRIEGNPDHPASLGGVDAITQAAILSLYDPDRSQAISARGEIRTWDAVVNEIESALREQEEKQGSGIRVLTETVTSPTLNAQLTQLLERYPRAKWHQYEPVNQDNIVAGAELAFGKPVETRYHFHRADVVFSFDSDFLSFGPGHVRYARDFLSGRRLPTVGERQADAPRLNRLYAVETNFTSTGAVADHRLPLPPSQIVAAAYYLAEAVGGQVKSDSRVRLSDDVRHWLDVAAADLRLKRSLVVVGPWQPPELHALVHAINAQLGNMGKTLEYTEPVTANPANQVESLRELVRDAEHGKIDLLLIAGGNPAYDAPSDIPFSEALDNIGLSLRLGVFQDETSNLCDWHIPAAHELESWSDARAFDGTASIIQPLIKPLYDGKTIHELVSVLQGQPDRTSHEILHEYWKGERAADGFDEFWRKVLHDGVVPDTKFSNSSTSLRELALSAEQPTSPPQPELLYRPDPTIHDGRFGNNAWLQELPKPVTKLTWGNAALISPRTANDLGVRNEQEVEIRRDRRIVQLPVLVVPGHADDSVTVHLGHGRADAGRVGSRNGTDVFPFRTTDGFWSVTNVALDSLTSHSPLACTQQHHRMEGRDLVRTASRQEFQDHPDFAANHAHHEEVSLYPSEVTRETDRDYAWGMSINLNSCTGCNACIVACQAENNIPTVGKDEVRRGREMHWIRVDHYFVGEDDNPRVRQQPVTCMHCENAPCEVVCPVAATVHSAEGLNEMVYNRCVGTRYCSNNCPYKVRRFNFLKYTDDETPVLKLLRNPDVTVRSQGVMEKCTYCVQRINSARIEAKKDGRTIRDGEVVTACQSVCPTQAIEFGDTADPDSRVSRLKSSPLDYGLLTELNTKPRTTYLARVTNPNPDLES